MGELLCLSTCKLFGRVYYILCFQNLICWNLLEFIMPNHFVCSLNFISIQLNYWYNSEKPYPAIFWKRKKKTHIYLCISLTQLNSLPLLSSSREAALLVSLASHKTYMKVNFLFCYFLFSSKLFFFFNSETNVWNRILVSLSCPKIGEVWPMLTFSGYF